ncbi:MAG: 16S rRNA (guanine(527)-N(7))-methyltransferase RsmG [Lentisphaeria bacterium]
MADIPAGLKDFLKSCRLPDNKWAELEKLQDLLHLLVAANKKTNLTRITSASDYWIKHIADSLSIGRFLPEIMSAPYRVADVGCGAGFPLLPLAWANPRLTTVGIEAKQKKTDFIESATRKLGIQNCTVIPRQMREAADLPEYRASFDIIVARAVKNAALVVKESHKLLKPVESAQIILYKTPDLVEKEHLPLIKAAAEAGLTVHYSDIFFLPQNKGRRQFTLVAKRT